MAWRPLRNIGLKLAALGLGTLLWFTVSGHLIERRVSSVPVSYSNVPSLLELTGDQMDTVSVRVRGNDNQVSSLREGQLQVVVDLTGAHPGTNIIPLRTDEVISPLGVEVLQVDPGTVTVLLERSGERSVTVAPSIDGQPAPGFVVSAIDVVPSVVTVAGPESRLDSPISVITERILIDGRSSTLVQDVSVGIADSQLRIVRPRTVRVTIKIAPAPSDGTSDSDETGAGRASPGRAGSGSPGK